MNGAESRNLGKKQFSTDNAVYVLKEIIEGKELKDIKFQNKLVLKINEIESIELPYYYPLVNGKPRISDKLINYLKNKNEF
jgi:ribosome biogenesis SPOUT family RNA methylase Rps3